MEVLVRPIRATQMAGHSTDMADVKRSLLDHLHADVLTLVFDQLLDASPSTLPAVSRVCRLFNELVNPFIYQNLVLGASWQSDPALAKIISMILDDSSKVRNYVRHVNVGSFTNMRPLELMEPLSHLTRLESIVIPHFSSEAMQDTCLIRSLESIINQNPRANLHFTARNSVEMPFLSSSNLYSLTMFVWPDFNRTDPFSDSLSRLKRLIISCKNLRILDLTITELPGEEPPSFDFDDGDQFPPLKELLLCGYSFTQANCVAWRRCMDWSEMQHLSFGTDYQSYFMRSFQDQLSNLRGFTTGIRVDDSPAELDRFISSLKLLEKLKIRNFTEGNLPLSLLTRPGRSLLNLDYLSRFVRVAKRPRVLSVDEIEELANKCPNIVSLVIGIELHRDATYDILRVLARFPLLHHLVIHVEIEENHVRILDPVCGKPTAKAMLKFIRARSPQTSRLSKLDVVFETCIFNWNALYSHMGMISLSGGTIYCSLSERDDRPNNITVESDEDIFMKQLGKRFKPGSAQWIRELQQYESQKLGPQVRRFLSQDKHI